MIVNSLFKPPWWLTNPHLQTVWSTLFRRRKLLDIKTDRHELADGDYLDLAWIGENRGPHVLILHGLGGCIHSPYANGLLHALDEAGYSPIFMHFRGCSGTPNRLPRSYHSGETGDLAHVIEYIGQVSERPLVALVGFSLGGNVLLKWLGEQREAVSIEVAVAVSVPFLLNDCARRLEKGLSRVYQAYLLRKLKCAYREKFAQIASPLDVDLNRLNNFFTFDDQITAPLHGFDGVHHYYATSSCRQYLKSIQIPTLIIHARDDPFMASTTIPKEEELSSKITFELSEKGGHVGFVTGDRPWRSSYWLEERIIEYLSDTIRIR